jgi:hypothetical protein
VVVGARVVLVVLLGGVLVVVDAAVVVVVLLLVVLLLVVLLLVVAVVVVVSAAAVVTVSTISCGLVVAVSRLAYTPAEEPLAISARLTAPSPWTSPVTSTLVQLPRATALEAATTASGCGALA